jgi:hypothetical protein
MRFHQLQITWQEAVASAKHHSRLLFQLAHRQKGKYWFEQDAFPLARISNNKNLPLASPTWSLT